MRPLKLCIGFLFFTAACAPVAEINQTTKVEAIPKKIDPGITTEQLAEGKNLYELNCVRCHKLYAPEKFTVARWNRIIPEMSQKAKIDADTEEKITKYLHTFSKVN